MYKQEVNKNEEKIICTKNKWHSLKQAKDILMLHITYYLR